MDLYDTRNTWDDIWQEESAKHGLALNGVLRRRWLPESRHAHYLGVTGGQTYLYMLKLPAGHCAAPTWPEMGGCLTDCRTYEESDYFCLELKRSEDWPVFKLLVQSLICDLEHRSVDGRSHLLKLLKVILVRCREFFNPRNREFSANEAKGLLGELYFLEHEVVPAVGWEHALSCWHGPMGAPQDFAVKGTTVELKCTQSANRQYVHISSSQQLDNPLCSAYLCVVGVEAAQGEGPEHKSVATMVERLAAMFEEETGSSRMFREAVGLVGFSAEATEARKAYRVLGCTFYAIREDFPRIRVSDLPPEINEVNYKIDLLACSRFIESPNWTK